MDPKEAYKRALAREPGAAQNLIEWLERGGALPVPEADPRAVAGRKMMKGLIPEGLDMRATFISALRKIIVCADCGNPTIDPDPDVVCVCDYDAPEPFDYDCG